MRILSHPGYPNGPVPAADLAERLEELKARSPEFAFWNESFSPAAWVKERGIQVGSSRLTDAYLLAIAAKHGGCLATFDSRIEVKMIRTDDAELVTRIL